MPSYPTQSTLPSPTSALIPSNPVPTPTYGPGGTFTVLAQTTISASPLEVLNLIRDVSTWGKWNTFCPSAQIKASPPNNESDAKNNELPGKGPTWLVPGMKVTIDVHMNGDGLTPGSKKSRTQDIEITHLQKVGEGGGYESSICIGEGEGKGRSRTGKGYMIAWKSLGWRDWQMRSERVMEFWEVDGGTDYVCWETFGGILGSTVKRMVGSQLVDRFGDYARDVKEFLEMNKGGDVAAQE